MPSLSALHRCLLALGISFTQHKPEQNLCAVHVRDHHAFTGLPLHPHWSAESEKPNMLQGCGAYQGSRLLKMQLRGLEHNSVHIWTEFHWKKKFHRKKKKKTASLVPNKSYLWAYLKRDGPNQQKHIFCSSSCCWGLLGLALFSSKNAAWASQTLHSVCKEWMHSVPRCGQQTCLQLLMLWRYCFAFLTA